MADERSEPQTTVERRDADPWGDPSATAGAQPFRALVGAFVVGFGVWLAGIVLVIGPERPRTKASPVPPLPYYAVAIPACVLLLGVAVFTWKSRFYRHLLSVVGLIAGAVGAAIGVGLGHMTAVWVYWTFL